MDGVTAWWSAMTVAQQMFACVAIPATLILILQTVLLMMGLGSGGDSGEFDQAGLPDSGVPDSGVPDTPSELQLGEEWDVPADVETDVPQESSQSEMHDVAGVRLFTVRGFVAFFAVGGWLGVVMIDAGMQTALATVVAIIGGSVALAGVAYLLKWSLKLQENGTLNLRDLITRTATVYIPIPAERAGAGKVTLTAQSQFLELDAITDASTSLSTGMSVQIVGLFAQNTLVVRPLPASAEQERFTPF